MTRMKGKTPYTKKSNAHVLSGWCLHSTFSYGDVLDPTKIYRGKNCVGKFVEHIEDAVKFLCATLSQQSATELSGVLKRDDGAAENCHICFKGFNNHENRRLRDLCHYTVAMEEELTTIST